MSADEIQIVAQAFLLEFRRPDRRTAEVACLGFATADGPDAEVADPPPALLERLRAPDPLWGPIDVRPVSACGAASDFMGGRSLAQVRVQGPRFTSPDSAAVEVDFYLGSAAGAGGEWVAHRRDNGWTLDPSGERWSAGS